MTDGLRSHAASERATSSISLQPDLAEVSRGRRFLAELASAAGFPEERTFDITVACSEAMANAIEHSPVKGEVRVRAHVYPDRLEVEVEGPGEFQAPDRLKDRGNRGLGLPLMAKLSDHLALFSGPNGETMVSLTFYRPGAVSGPPGPLPPSFVDLSEENKLLDDVLSQLPDGFYVLDDEWRFIYLNPAVLAPLHAEPGQLLGRVIWDVFADLDTHARRAFETARKERAVCRVTAGSASGLWHEWTAFPVDEGIAVFSKDITQRKQAEDALTHSEAALRGILNATQESIWVFTTAGRVALANTTAARRLGRTPEEVIGRTFEELLPAPLAEARRMQIGRVAATGIPAEFEDERAGIAFRHSFYPIFDEQGRVDRVVSFSRDITEQRSAEEALRKSALSFSLVFAKAPLPMALSHQGLLVDVNEAWERFFGYSRDEALGRTTLELGVNPDAAARAAMLSELAESGALQDCELFLHTKTGDGKTVLVNIDTVDIDGERYSLSAVRDITSERAAELEREKLLAEEQTLNEELTASNEELLAQAEQLAQSEERFRLALQNAPVSLAAVDRSLRFTWAYNQRTATPDEVVGRTDWDLFPFEAARLIEIKREVIETGAERHEGMWITRPGRRVFLDLYFHPMRDHADQVTGLWITAVDLTDQKIAEERETQAAERLERVLEHITGGFYELDSEGRFVRANETTEAHLGQSREKFMGRTLWEVTGIKPESDIGRRYEEVFRTGEPQTFETQSQVRTDRWMETHLHPTGSGIEVYFRDISRRKEAERATQELAEQRQVALDAAQMGWWRYDPATNISTFDRRYKEIFGVAEDAKPNDEILARLHPDDQPEVWARVEEAMDPRAPRPYFAEYRIFLPDGSLRWIEAHGIATFAGEGDQRRATSLVGTVLDITDRKKAHEEMANQREVMQRVFDNIPVLLMMWDPRLRRFSLNLETQRVLGWTTEEANDGDFMAMVYPDAGYRAEVTASMQSLEEGWRKWLCTTKAGDEATIEWANTRLTDDTFISIGVDVGERKAADERQHLLTELLQVLNRGGDPEEVIGESLRLMQQAAGFDAVGLRLRGGDDYPYFEQSGFSTEFLDRENSLCALDGVGAVIHNADGRVLLECTCGLVLSGRTDPDMSCFTVGGSFWTNRSSDLLALPLEDDPRNNPRNFCIHSGYQSVGLFPVRAGEEIIGLLQLNDRREGRFTSELVGFYENLALNLGLALQRTSAEQALRESEERFRLLVEQAPDGIFLADAQGTYTASNDAGLQLLGYTLDELRRMTVADVIVPEEVPRMPTQISNLRGGQVLTNEWLFRRKDGSTFIGEVVGRQFPDGRLLGILRNVSERKETERQRDELLRHHEELSRLDRALTDVSESLNSTLDMPEILRRVVERGAVALGAEEAVLELAEPDGWKVERVYGLPEELQGQHLSPEEASVATAMREEGALLVIEDAHSDARVNTSTVLRYGTAATLAVPVTLRAEILGSLQFMWTGGPRSFSIEELDFARKLSNSLALALENARLYGVEHDIATQLQSIILQMPGSLPHVEFSHLYRAATEEVLVGGDFYDAFEIEEGVLAFVIGDVSGHGVQAARVATLVKASLAAFYGERRDPEEVLSRVNQLLIRKAMPGFTSLLLAIYHVREQEVSYCSAGHPDAFIAHAGGDISVLPGNHPPLGVFADWKCAVRRVPFRPGDLLLLYTDGLTEARTDGNLFGEARLAATFAKNLSRPLGELPGALLDAALEFSRGRLRDDVAILAVRALDDASA